jgi:shikimate kinase
MKNEKRIVLTGFMGVGKTSVARHLSFLLDCERLDLDFVIEESEGREIADIINDVGLERYRQIETENLKKVLLNNSVCILALGGGTWTIKENRELLKKHDFVSVWLESTFEHCWQNIRLSKKERPLAKNRIETKKLFDERENIYCLADWHFIIKSEFTSFEIAKQIAEEIF